METTQIALQRKIKLRPHTNGGELGNVSGLEFSFLDDKDECLFDLHYCKDFWNEIFYAAKYNITPFPVYDWVTDLEQIKKLDYPNKPIRMLLVNKADPDFLKEDKLKIELINLITLLNHIEKANSMNLTLDGSIEELDNNRLGIVINLSIDWFDSPSKISLLGLIIRNCRYYNGGSIVEYLTTLPKSDFKAPEAYLFNDKSWLKGITMLMDGTLKHNKFDDDCVNYDCPNVNKEVRKTLIFADSHDLETEEVKELQKKYNYWNNIHNHSGFQYNYNEITKYEKTIK